MTKLLIFLFCGLLSVTGCNQNNKTDDNSVCPTPIASGTTGELTWELCEDGTLTISGKGEMPDYTYNFDVLIPPTLPPWHEYRDNITGVIIGDDVSNIGAESFSGCIKLNSVSIGNSVTDIGVGAFSGCLSLASIELPNSVINIGGEAFYTCTGLSSVTIGKSVTTIGSASFRRCDNLTEILINRELPPYFYRYYSELLVRSEHTFGDVDMENVTLWVPDAAVKAYSCAEVWRDFGKIAAIGHPNSFVTECKCDDCPTDIACGTTYQVSWALTSEGVLTISGKGKMPDYNYDRWISQSITPWGQSLITSVIIKDGVTNISNTAFSGCSGLTSITIPNSVTSIGLGAFFLCTGLSEIFNHQAIPLKIDNNLFHDVNKITSTLFVPVGTVDVYRVAEGWKKFENIKEFQ